MSHRSVSVLNPFAIAGFIDRLLIALILVLALAVAPARADGGSLRTTHPQEATSGALLFKAVEEGRFIEAPRIATDVAIEVTGPFIRTRVTQSFENPTDGWVEGVYVFPLPENAAVDALKLQIGDRFIEGRIEERRKAKEIYEAARAEGRKASLLEQERPNIFTNSVANIGPGENIIVQIEYQETARFSDGVFSLRFPMVVAPRYNPVPIVQTVSVESGGWGAVEDPVADRQRIEAPVLDPALRDPVNPVTLSIDIDAGFPLGDVVSAHHPIRRDNKGRDRARLTLAEETVPADRDFVLTWAPKSGSGPSAALFTETIDGEAYYLAMIMPPAADVFEPRARDVTFVIDTSGSMAGESIRQAKKSLKLALARLAPSDRFNVIEFNSTMRALFSAPVAADPAHVNRAIGFVSALEANGGTEMLPALNAALIDHGAGPEIVRQVIFLTDGAIGNETQLFETIAARRGRARIFTVGIGSAPNSFFMARAAEIGQGTFTHIGAVEDVAAQMGALFAKLEAPAVTDLVMSWPAGVVVEAWPSPLPDVYLGEPVVIAARASAAGGGVALKGRQGDQTWRVNLNLDQASARTGVSKLWARRKIAATELDIARSAVARDEADAVILATALRHQLVSRLTSLVAVDVTPSRPVGERLDSVRAPLNLPAGWDFGKVFGETQARQREALAPAPTPTSTAEYAALVAKRAPAPAAAADAANPAAKGVDLPQGGLFSDVKLLIGLLMIVFSIGLYVAYGRFHGQPAQDKPHRPGGVRSCADRTGRA